MKIGITTFAHPRMEFSHIEEWLGHLRNHKVDRIWVIMDDSPYVGNEKIDIKGRKHISYYGRTDMKSYFNRNKENIEREFAYKCHKYGAVVHPISEISTEAKTEKRQKAAINFILQRLWKEEEPWVDWIGAIDVDEFLVCNRSNLKTYLESIRDEISVVKIGQRLFKNRFWNRDPIPVKDISENWGCIRNAQKLFIRTDKEKPVPFMPWIHGVDYPGTRKLPDFEEFCFYHFRGLPWVEKETSIQGPVDPKYYRMITENKMTSNKKHLKWIN